jgi:uncharacterized protein (TIGR02099 family)
MSRLLAFVLVFLRRGLWLGAIGLMLLALYVSLGRQLVPLVAEYRPEVQSKARELLEMPVMLGRLEGRWAGLSPRLVAHDVILGEGDQAMRLDQLTLVPDVVGSLLARRVRLSSVELGGLHLGLRQDGEGRWHVQGLPERGAQRPSDLSGLLSRLQDIRQLRLLDSQITLEANAQPPVTLTYANLALETGAGHLRLDGRLLLPDGQPLSLHGQARPQPEDWKASEAELYLSLPQSDWAAWLPTSFTGDWRLEQLQAGGELWLDWRGRGLARAVARLNAPALRVAQLQREPVQLSDLALNVYLDRTDSGYRAQLGGLAFTYSGERWQDTAVLVDRDIAQDRWQLRADHLPIAPVAALTGAAAPLSALASEYLTALSPQGTLRNLQFDYRPAATGPERVTFSANLDGVGVAPYHWVPGLRNVSGEVRGNLAGGELRFDNHDFALHLDPLFPEPWNYHRARGSLRWTLNDQAVTLVAPYLQIEGEEGLLAGDFLIRLMHDPAAEDYMDLRVGLSNSDARFVGKYLPTRSPALSPALTEWLQTAIRGGSVEQGYFLYQGSINRGSADAAHSLSLYFKVKDAELAVEPGWPLMRDIRGEVLIEDSGVRVRVSEARMLDSRIHDVIATVPHGPEVKALRLAVAGQVDGHLRDAISLLQVAPIGTNELFAGWRGDGPLAGTLNLDIPLGKGEPARVIADFSSSDASLFIPQANLQLDAINGGFRYDSGKGLSSKSFTARTLGSQIKGSADAVGQSGSPSSRIQASGTVGVQALLDWQAMEQPVPASGQLPLAVSLVLGGNGGYLQADSTLSGTVLALPAPFGKTADEPRDTSLRLSLGGERQQLSLRHGDLAALAFSAPIGRLPEGGGELVLGGGAANGRAEQGLVVHGSLATFDLSEWTSLLERYSQSSANRTGASMLREVRLDIGAFEGFGAHIDGLNVGLERSGDGWNLGLVSSRVTGTVTIPDADGVPMSIDLSRLRLPAAEPGAEPAPDALANVDPKSLPSMDIEVTELLRGDEPLGSASLKVRPGADGATFDDLALDLRGLKIGGTAGWNHTGTWYKGRLQGSDLAGVLLAWGYAPSTSSREFRLDVDGRWPGSPAYFALERLSGTLDARLRKGQLREIDGGTQALRIFGLLNFDSIGRRLRLDFSDLFSKGLSYDQIDAELLASDGVYRTTEPLTVAGPSTNLELNGTLDLVKDQIDAKLLVTLPVSNNLPLAALIVGAPAIGGALFVVDKLLGDRVARFASVQYNVEGPWQSPKITFDKPFEKPN